MCEKKWFWSPYLTLYGKKDLENDNNSHLKRLASSIKGLLSASVKSFQSAPSLLDISELCILGFSCAIFLRWPRDQTMKAFIGLLMWSIGFVPGPIVTFSDCSRLDHWCLISPDLMLVEKPVEEVGVALFLCGWLAWGWQSDWPPAGEDKIPSP